MSAKTNYLIFAAFAAFLSISTLPQLCRGQRGTCYRNLRPRHESPNCDPFARYRTLSGRCNNLGRPEWGSAGATLRRLLPNAYADGRDEPRGGRNPRSSLPSARHVSQKNHPDNDVPDTRFTHMVMQFGQFLDHDLTLTPHDEELDCCETFSRSAKCFTIAIPSPDRFFSWVNDTVTCQNFVRSTPVCNLNTREQYNEITSFVDASMVYGSDIETAAILRTYQDGRLQRNSNTDQLPTREQLNLRPNTRKLRAEKPEDFVAGDSRSNEQPFLATLHVVFLREHNRIAKRLKEYLPSHLRTDEIIYQEARRLVAAEMQNVVYGEYLPTVLGVDYMQRHGLIVEEETRYDDSVDPGIINEFATAAFRFGHSMINGMFKLVSQRRNNREKDVYWLWRLREVFDGQSVRGARIPLENMLEGLITQEPQTCDSFFTTEITDHLFQQNTIRQNFGADLLSLNLQRGRDHGIPGYNSYRARCGMKKIEGWYDRPQDFDEQYWKKLQEVYERVDDIDLYVGGVAEGSVRGGVVGPTFACIMGEQFGRLKRGDRFFYTHVNANGLGPVAKTEVLKRTLGDIMCDVSRMGSVQKWVTLQPNSEYNSYERCVEKTQLDVRAIADEIARELSTTRRTTTTTIPTRRPTSFSTSTRPRTSFSTSTRPREVVRSRTLARTLPSRNSLLHRGNTITHERVPEDFAFPQEIVSEEQPLQTRFSRKSVLVGAAAVPNALTTSSPRRRKTFRPSTLLQQSAVAASAPSSSGFRPIRQPIEYEQANEVHQFRNRLASKGLIGVSTFACLHQLC